MKKAILIISFLLVAVISRAQPCIKLGGDSSTWNACNRAMYQWYTPELNNMNNILQNWKKAGFPVSTTATITGSFTASDSLTHEAIYDSAKISDFEDTSNKSIFKFYVTGNKRQAVGYPSLMYNYLKILINTDLYDDYSGGVFNYNNKYGDVQSVFKNGSTFFTGHSVFTDSNEVSMFSWNVPFGAHNQSVFKDPNGNSIFWSAQAQQPYLKPVMEALQDQLGTTNGVFDDTGNRSVFKDETDASVFAAPIADGTHLESVFTFLETGFSGGKELSVFKNPQDGHSVFYNNNLGGPYLNYIQADLEDAKGKALVNTNTNYSFLWDEVNQNGVFTDANGQSVFIDPDTKAPFFYDPSGGVNYFQEIFSTTNQTNANIEEIPSGHSVFKDPNSGNGVFFDALKRTVFANTSGESYLQEIDSVEKIIAINTAATNSSLATLLQITTKPTIQSVSCTATVAVTIPAKSFVIGGVNAAGAAQVVTAFSNINAYETSLIDGITKPSDYNPTTIPMQTFITTHSVTPTFTGVIFYIQ